MLPTRKNMVVVQAEITEEWIESPDGWGPDSVRKALDDGEEEDDLPSAGADLFANSVDPRETFRYNGLVASLPPSSTATTRAAAAAVVGRVVGGEETADGPIIVLSGYKLDSDNTDQSTGVTLWRAAPLLADYLVQRPDLVRARRVLELGAGLGLCGLVAHHLGATTTVLTDGDKYALKQLRHNVHQNAVSYVSSSSSDATTSPDTAAANTDTGTTSAEGIGRRIIECRTLLWGKTPPPTTESEKFDVILGADVIYGWDSFEPLLDTVSAWMKRSRGSSSSATTTTTTTEDGEEATSPASQFLLSWKTRYNGVPVDVVQSAARDRHLSWTEVSDGIYRLSFIMDGYESLID